MGVRTIDTLSQIPIRLLEREFGKPGRTLWEKANAIDTTPIVPYHEQKSMSKERTFYGRYPRCDDDEASSARYGR